MFILYIFRISSLLESQGSEFMNNNYFFSINVTTGNTLWLDYNEHNLWLLVTIGTISYSQLKICHCHWSFSIELSSNRFSIFDNWFKINFQLNRKSPSNKKTVYSFDCLSVNFLKTSFTAFVRFTNFSYSLRNLSSSLRKFDSSASFPAILFSNSFCCFSLKNLIYKLVGE